MSQIVKHAGLKRAPGLTGLRAAAVLLVMVYHLGLPIFGGFIGVNIFFVLSGFLITHLLLDERFTLGRIAFGNFYARRALRLYPALLALVLVVTLYSALIPNALRAAQSISATPSVVLYFSNWMRAFPAEVNSLGLYEHTWSLSIEEQFYLVWPLILWVTIVVSKKLIAVGIVAAVGIAASIATRLFVAIGGDGNSRISNGTDTQADQLLFGALLAVLMIAATNGGWQTKLRVILGGAFWPSVILLLAVVLFWPHHGDSLHLRLLLSGVAIAASVLVGYVYLAPQNWLQRILSSPVAVHIGDRSYGLYLWHYPIFTLVLSIGIGGPARLVLMVLAFALAFLFAEASYRFVELPFLKLKDRLAKKQHEVDPSPRSPAEVR